MHVVCINFVFISPFFNIKVSRKGVKTKELNYLKLKRFKQRTALIQKIISSLVVYKLEHSYEALLFICICGTPFFHN